MKKRKEMWDKAFIVIVILISAFVLLSVLKNITGNIIGEHTITLYSSKSGLMSSQDSSASFSTLGKSGKYWLGGDKDYRHYEYFKLASIPATSRIISATLTIHRVNPGKEVDAGVKMGREVWQEYQTYKTKSRYPLTFGDEVIVRSKGDLIFDVTPFVQTMILPGIQYENWGFEILMEKGEQEFYFKNAPYSERPKLEVVYSTVKCVARTCSQMKYECGIWKDDCGKNMVCENCASGKVCNSIGKCV